MAGQQSGVYVIFGKFQDTWQPSTGAPSSARTVIAQRWALPGSSFDSLNPGGANAAYVKVDSRGNFVAELTVGEVAGTGNYGFYTYPGGGATNAAHELAVPASFEAAT